jgi:S-(hydroxymethyl)glutathione dehydrogenase/alcohol dehydrogenase
LLTLPAIRLPREEKMVTGSLYGSARPHLDMPLLLDLYMAGRLLLDELVSGTFALADINHAIEALEEGEATRPLILFNDV